MDDFFAGPVFQVDHETFSWRDVVLFTHRLDRWEPLLRDMDAGLTAVRLFGRDEDEALEARAEAAAAEFRYDRDLITAEETEAWLRERGTTAAEWLAGIRRAVFREHYAGRLVGLGRAGTSPRRELVQAIRVELLCTGLGRELAEVCAEYAAAAAAVGCLVPGAAPVGLPDSLPPGLEASHALTRLPLLDQIREGADRFRQAVMTDEALGREMQLHKMEWVRLECRTLTFPDLPAAREAVLCIREDGIDIDEVAANAGLEAADARFYVDDMEPSAQASFVSAMMGDLIGPSATETGYTLFHVLSKAIPEDSDPEIRERAAGRLFARALANEAQRRVRWTAGW